VLLCDLQRKTRKRDPPAAPIPRADRRADLRRARASRPVSTIVSFDAGCETLVTVTHGPRGPSVRPVQDGIHHADRSSTTGEPSAPAVRILAVDDHRAFREALQDLIAAAPEFVLVGQASSGEEAVRNIECLTPQLVLMDVLMPGIGGIAAAQTIMTRYPNVVILLLSVDDPAVYLGGEYLGDGVGCLRKQDLSPEGLSQVWHLLHH
jgi:CheY-like chemotaxis protein